MNIKTKTILILFIFLHHRSFAQSNNWILGTWHGLIFNKGDVHASKFEKTLSIDSLSGSNFIGKLINDVHDKKGTRLDVAVSGTMLSSGQLTITQDSILYKKDPPSGAWINCSGCISNIVVITTADSIILSGEVKDCKANCDGVFRYYRLLPKPEKKPDTILIAKATPVIKEENHSTDTVVAKAPVPKKEKQHKDTIAVAKPKPVLKNKPHTDTAVVTANKRDTIRITPKAADTIRAQLQRTTLLAGKYTVTDPEIKIELFDNATIDGDMVSVYHNKERIINKKTLAREPLVYKLKASAQDRIHEFILVAENLGSIPPNTALMRITAGNKSYELIAKTNLQENATITIEYIGN